jgi:L-2-hydroxyglutarate oxidase LhgO
LGIEFSERQGENMSRTYYDVIIVGGGIMGAATAYNLMRIAKLLAREPAPA